MDLKFWADKQILSLVPNLVNLLWLLGTVVGRILQSHLVSVEEESQLIY